MDDHDYSEENGALLRKDGTYLSSSLDTPRTEMMAWIIFFVGCCLLLFCLLAASVSQRHGI